MEGRQREALLGHLRWDAAIYDHFDRVLDQKIAVRITAVFFKHSRFFQKKTTFTGVWRRKDAGAGG